MAGYKVRNEKGNFKSGTCQIETSKIIVLKFAPVEAKVSYLIEAIQGLNLDETLLDEKNLKLLQEIRQTEINFSSAS